MIAHVVLFRPRRDLSREAREALATSFEAALKDISSIRRARVGRRLVLGRPYDALMKVDYQYAAILEFDDRAALTAYLDHASHERLASQFFSVFEEALMYDFELTEGSAKLDALVGDTN